MNRRKDRIVPDGSALDPALQFMRLMWAVDHELQSMSKRMSATVGLTGPQRLAVILLARYPGLAAGQLAALLHLDPGTVTGIIGRLVTAGLVNREEDEHDARRLRLTLTRKGQAVNRRRVGTVEGAVRTVLAAMPDEDHAAAVRVLTRLVEELEGLASPGAKRERPRRAAAAMSTEGMVRLGA
ncbi:MAG: winged helix-turn-helix transcriptional regulator [Acidobacteria bacterium]|nr:winged helix-turn-helix transcriptional regulator [Acidobacteriota bacterium]